MEGEDGSFICLINMGSLLVGIVFFFVGNLLVVEAGFDRISVFDVVIGLCIGIWNSGGGLNNLVSMCYGFDGVLYVGSWGNDKIVCFNVVSGVFVDNFVFF